MEAMDRARHVPPGEGKALWLAGELITRKVAAEDTNGALAVAEVISPPQSGPPPHVHSREDETFYVLEGDLEFMVGDRTVPVTAGSIVYGPRGILHTYKNVGTEPSRMLVTITPAGFEKFFEEVGEPATDPSSPPPFGQEEIERLLATAPKYGMEIPPPPE